MKEAATLTRVEAAQYLGFSVDTLDRLRARGRLSALQVSKRLVKYRRSDLDAYLEACLITPSPASEAPPTGISSGSKTGTRDAFQFARQIVARQKRF